MAKNDVLLLDGIIDERIANNLTSKKRDEAFEFLAFEQLLKGYDLSFEDLSFGIIDGRDDGGIDGFYTFVNGHLLVDPESFTWPKSGALLEVWIITCKHHDTFKQAPLDNMAASLSELLDFRLSKDELRGDYSTGVLRSRENLRFAYRKLSPKLSHFNVTYAYASRGDSGLVGESIKSRSSQIVDLTKESFGTVDVEFSFVGSAELVRLHRIRPNFSLELPFSEVLSSGEKYVLLADLRDYYRFVTDDGKLRRYLFDSNVRDFMGLNRVNEDIRKTLENTDSTDFWCLNNGVTVLATSARVVGDCIQLDNIQIVNGLQTTESIFRYFEAGGKDPKNRSILIKVIVSQDEDVRDSIIRATNNQTDVELASLHATDKIQRDIEDILRKSDYMYERRKNYHINVGGAPASIITPLYLASGYVNLVLKSPSRASDLRSRFMRSSESYNKVFSSKTPLLVYPVIAKILKETDARLEHLRPGKGSAGEGFLKRWRQLVSFITVSRLLKTFDFSAKVLSEIDLNKYTAEEIDRTWRLICDVVPEDISVIHLRKKHHFLEVIEFAAKSDLIANFDVVENWVELDGMGYKNVDAPRSEKSDVSLEFAMKVDSLLPPQPWKPGIHLEVMRKLNCSKREYAQSIELLIDEGIRNRQENGVVYDVEGNVIAFDVDRVNPQTLQLW